MHGIPNLIMSLTPSPFDDPVAHVFSGYDLDLDTFVPGSYDHGLMVRTMDADPFLRCKFFNFMVTAVVEELFGIRENGSHSIVREEGIFSCLAGYIGTIEPTGDGSLTLQILLWLDGSPTLSEMHEALQSLSFRQKLATFMAANHQEIGETLV